MALWEFVGRRKQLDRLIAAATGVTGRGLLISGTAGIGKSRLLSHLVKQLPPDRYAVWSASANIATSGLPFGGLAQVLPADQPSGLSPAGILRWAVDALHQQAAGRSIVLAVDDIHLLDDSSAALVYLIARSDDATVLSTMLTGSVIPLPIRALWTDDLVEHLELPALTLAEATELAGAILGIPVDPPSAERLWRFSGGNALLLRELVKAANDSGELVEMYGVLHWTGQPGLTATLDALIDSRVTQFSPGVRTAVELVAFGEPIGEAILKQAVPCADAEAAEQQGLIRTVQHDRRRNVVLAHPIYGEVVRQRCPVIRLRRLTAQLADLVERTGARRRDDLLRVAVWRLESDTADKPEPLLRAAGLAFSQYDVPLAGRLARAALRTGGGFAAAELLATILMFGDQPREAIEVLDSVADEITCDQQRSRWLTVRGMVSYWGLSQESTIESIEADVEQLTDLAHRARVRSFEAIMRLHRLDCAGALRLSRRVLDRPAASVAARGLARCTIAHLQAARGELVQSGRAIASVEADAAQWRGDMPYLQLALELARGTRLALAGDLAGIDTIVADEFADLADAGDFRLGSGYLSILRAQAARLRGQTGDALRFSLGACAVLAGSPAFAGLAHAERTQAAALRGDVEQAALAMAESDRMHICGMEVLYPWREQARAAMLASAGNIGSAVRTLAELVRRLRADGFAGHEVHALHDLVRLGHADFEIDQPSSKQQPNSEHEPNGDQQPEGTARPLGAGRRQTVAQRLTELSETVDGRLPPLLARHARAAATRAGEELLAVAESYAEQGLNVYAAEAAAEAVTRLRAVRSPQAHAANLCLGDLLARCDVVRSPVFSIRQPTLTERERQIARLAAGGLPSRNIAEELYISTRTVENHLQRVYSKLGVTGRSELWSALRAMPDPDSRPGR
ncbi:LuxR family transcriptional regulator [Micromonospora polyrhachis]|uniref:DNA-binding CsgD family transcriptional regulator n=1 Tax=Micromonospora polyrhachis TaxID=1282883 RepID=A0A7W7SN46_9ACTN|nr:LuxR family transcriptional regulator [Micromonospora polyrhachis]MBB4957820.1 DNA-binding CsgD family transcriptional regulator [Micromonospora polyrhachis]